MNKLLLSLAFLLASLTGSAVKFPKVLLAGDYPDPTILRDGEDYYMTHSPFHYTPGFLIWHSRDLQHWEPVCRAVPEFKGSAMAPDLIKHDGRYYIYFPSAGTNWVTWADDIRGPWSKPVDLRLRGIDPGHVADEKGNRYLFVNNGEVIALTPDGLATAGEKRTVYKGWEYPKHWDTEGMYLESPKLTYHDGYYYLTSAQGGTAGPPTSHMIVSARSRNINGPWENSPYNPIVHTYTSDDNWWSRGHGTLVDDTDGNWWVVYHAYPNSFHTLGRYTLIEPVAWTADGWFKALPEARFPQVAVSGDGGKTAADGGMPLSDDFEGNTLGLQWTLWGENGSGQLTFGNGAIKVEAKGTTPADSRLLLITAQHKSYTVQTEVTIGKGSTAGLLLYYNDKAYAGLTSDGHRLFIYSSPAEKKVLKRKAGRHLFIRLHNRANRLSIDVSDDNRNWQTVAEDIDVSQYHHNNYGGFYALRPTLSVSGNGYSAFHDFTYTVQDGN